jgi:hypothetical protein
MAISGLLGNVRRKGEPDFTDRLPPAVGSADPAMVAPYAGPGDAMPNADVGNLNQSPNQDVLGYLQAALRYLQQQGVAGAPGA